MCAAGLAHCAARAAASHGGARRDAGSDRGSVNLRARSDGSPDDVRGRSVRASHG